MMWPAEHSGFRPLEQTVIVWCFNRNSPIHEIDLPSNALPHSSRLR
jgi:hypothetical protein